MRERSHSRWSFASWRPRSRRKAREAREAALAQKSSSDDLQVSYSMDNVKTEVQGTMTPPVERKTKKSTIPRFFKPWKWKRKKKEPSKEPIQAYGSELPQSTRQSLPTMQEAAAPTDTEAAEPEAAGNKPEASACYVLDNLDSDAQPRVPEAASASDNTAGPHDNPQTATMDQAAISVAPDITKVEINSTNPDTPPVTTTPDPNLGQSTLPEGIAPPLPEKTGRVSPAGPIISRASPAVPPKERAWTGNAKIAGSPAVNHSGQSVGFAVRAGVLPPTRGVGFGSHLQNIPAADGDAPEPKPSIGQCNGDINRAVDSDEDSLSDYDNKENTKDESDSDEDYNTSLIARVKRNDSLAFHLRNRPTREALQERNILPQQSYVEKKQIMNAIGSKLVRRLSQRPTQEELQQRNIYRDENSDKMHKDWREERKRTLVRKLSFRPTIEELRQKNIIKFNEYVEVMEAFEYDRRGEKPWTKLTPQDKASIRKELNDFKSAEMNVHEDSKKYTRFHRP